MPPDTLAASCQDVAQVYAAADGPAHALRGVTFDIRAHTITAVVGPSGAGKSTLLRLLACLERPTVGEVLIAGEPTSHLSARARRRLVARHVGYVFQSPPDNLIAELTAAEHIGLAARLRTPAAPDVVNRLLETTALVGQADARPIQLSAGEQQRLAFAMAVAGSPDLVVADEPTASLDPGGAKALVDVFPSLVANGQTLVVSTHDRAIIRAADRVLLLRNGTLAAEATGDGDLLAVLDDADRIQLPPDVRGLFPARRARLTAHGDHLRIEPR